MSGDGFGFLFAGSLGGDLSGDVLLGKGQWGEGLLGDGLLGEGLLGGGMLGEGPLGDGLLGAGQSGKETRTFLTHGSLEANYIYSKNQIS